MALNYVKYQNQNDSSVACGKTFLRAVQTETLDLAALADHMAEHNSVFSKGTILGVLTDMASCIRENMLDGKAIKIDDVCILRLGFSCNGADTPAEATPKNITGLNVNAMGTGRMAVRTLINNVQFKELKKYAGIVGEGETEENADPETPEATLYTLTFKHNNAVYETQQYEAGATVTPPTPPTGFVWQNCPDEMPARDTIVASVDANDLSQNL